MPRRNKRTTKYSWPRRHTNNDGRRGIKNGTYRRQLKRLARELEIPFEPDRDDEFDAQARESWINGET